MPQAPKYRLPPSPLDSINIGDRIASVRKIRGLTQVELAEKIGITQKLVTDYERSRLHLNDEMIRRFSVALEISSDELLGLSEIPYKKELPLRYMRRMKEIENMPENKRKAILKTLDDLIRANS